jgi:hypothetical protein
MYILHVRVVPYVYDACPCCLSMLHVYAVCRAAYPCQCCMSCPCCISPLLVLVAYPCSMSVSTSALHVYAVCALYMRRVHAAYHYCMALLHVNAHMRAACHVHALGRAS